MTNRRLLSAAIAATLVFGTYQAYAYDENFKGYEVHKIIVKADAAKDEYGNTITEQSYYRTGGDVKVITREEIEKRHYRDVTEAINAFQVLPSKTLVTVVVSMATNSITMVYPLMVTPAL